ncbi:hexose carrier protein HEX6-like [Andrographis paniculata]|uniref:hexose carrier protein HEX6-like n=1 Tax=Andrographis paniculata TaxID=175694 RepID=UPI0021E9A603|nr:hexose carrier protein HEX6-like [Andrographis paniculata]XP_051142682.1 hexose carrier protein HEX6-like [Andrographis paniculata]
MAAGEYYNGKITWFVLLSSIVAAFGGMIFGYASTVTGGVMTMKPFLKKFFPRIYANMEEDVTTSNYCKFDSQILTLFGSSIFISGLISSFLASPVTKALGRKASLLIGGVSFIIGACLGSAAYNLYMLMIGRILQGFAIGFINQSAPLYLSEMAPPKYRGAFNSGFQMCINIGGLLAFVVNYATEKILAGWGWRLSLAAAAAPALILTAGGLFLPETPNSLLQRGCDHETAKKMLQKIRGSDDVQAELDDLAAAGRASKSLTKNPFRTILERKYRPQLVMSVAIPFFQQLNGINAVAFYIPQLFSAVGSGVSDSLLAGVIISLVGSPTTLISLAMVDRVGRRALFHAGGVLMLVTHVAVGAVMAAKLGDAGALSRGYGVAVLVLVAVYVAGFGISWGPLAWLVTSEIFPLEVRSAAQSISVATGFVFTFASAQTFLAMLCHMKAGIFFFFAAWVAVMTAFVYMFLPETKDVPIEKMERIWREHWFWRRFVVEDAGAAAAAGGGDVEGF